MTRLQEARQAYIEADKAVYAYRNYRTTHGFWEWNNRRRAAYAAWIAAVRDFNRGVR